MKILSIVGARPQFIKAAIVSRALATAAKQITEILVHTGQHYDDNMSAIFFAELGISQPEYNLNIGSLTHGCQTGKMLIAIEDVLQETKPDWVLVYGDTNSTLAGALAAAKLNIPVAHIEAGLRSFNQKMPEEINRIMTDHISSLLFAPTDTAVKNLLHEGIAKEKIHLVGDVMYDAALYYGDIAIKKSQILQRLDIEQKQYVLVTIHRAENTDKQLRLLNIIETLIKLSDEYCIIMPLHPRTQKIKEQLGIDEYPPTIKFIDPVGYFDMVVLEKKSCFIITDSGGIQKEAFFYNKPCITMRDETEWVELKKLGWNKVLSPEDDAVNLYKKIKKFLNGFSPKNKYSYGHGDAAKLIASIIK